MVLRLGIGAGLLGGEEGWVGWCESRRERRGRGLELELEFGCFKGKPGEGR